MPLTPSMSALRAQTTAAPLASRRLSRLQAVVLMIAVSLMWSIAGVVSRQLQSAQSFEVTFWRSFFTVISLVVLLPLVQGRRALAQIPWRSGVLWISGACWGVMFTAFMVALTLTSVANVLIVMALGPLATALVSWGFLRQSVPARTWWAIAAAALGIAYMYAPQLAGPAAGVPGGSGAWLGSLVALCVPLAAAVQWTLTQALQNRSRGDPSAAAVDLVPAVLLGALISCVLTLPMAAPFRASATDVAWLALLGAVQLAIPCGLSVVCARSLSGPEVSLLALLEIIFGIGLVWLLAGEAPGANTLIGGGVVLSALVLNELVGLRASR